MSDSKETKSAPSGATQSWIDLPPIVVVETAQAFKTVKEEFCRAIWLRYERSSKVGQDRNRFLATAEVVNSITYVTGRRLAIYRQDGAVVGLMTFSVRKSDVQVDQLVGNPYFRNVGPLLLEFALNITPRLILLPIDKGTHKFYSSMGFVPGKPRWTLDPSCEPGSTVWAKLGGQWRLRSPSYPTYLGLFEPPVKPPPKA